MDGTSQPPSRPAGSGVVGSQPKANVNTQLTPFSVYLRVRPFLKRETSTSSFVEVDKKDPSSVRLLLSNGSYEEYSFKRCFDGTERGRDAVDSAVASSSPLTTDQASVYAHVGLPVLTNVVNGYNGCVLAYGQTGSGKTFTMMGPNYALGSSATTNSDASSNVSVSHSELEGITPRLIRDLYRTLEEKQRRIHEGEEFFRFKVEVEYYEVYQEKVMDLFTTSAKKTFLSVRNHSESGPYVVGLTRKSADSVVDVIKWIRKGNKERHVSNTLMNDRSSRSHSVLTLHISQSSGPDESMLLTTVSKLSLVDLAGSERAASCGAKGKQLEEANKINSSLTVLGRVIDSLADVSQGKSAFVPYRDSTLTWLLMNFIGGNSKTTLIATVSPQQSQGEETSQTLRYASRAKQIVTKTSSTEDRQTRQIRLLTSELKRLNSMSSGQQGEYLAQLEQRVANLEESIIQKDLVMSQLQADLDLARSAAASFSPLKQLNTNAMEIDPTPIVVPPLFSRTSTQLPPSEVKHRPSTPRSHSANSRIRGERYSLALHKSTTDTLYQLKLDPQSTSFSLADIEVALNGLAAVWRAERLAHPERRRRSLSATSKRTPLSSVDLNTSRTGNKKESATTPRTAASSPRSASSAPPREGADGERYTPRRRVILETLDSSIELPDLKDGEDKEKNVVYLALKEKLDRSEVHVHILQRILVARDHVYTEMNRFGVNPACVTSIVEEIEEEGRSRLEEVEFFKRTLLETHLKMSLLHCQEMKKMASELAIMSQSCTMEKNRSQQLCRVLDGAHRDQEALMEANTLLLKKVHYLKRLKKQMEAARPSDIISESSVAPQLVDVLNQQAPSANDNIDEIRLENKGLLSMVAQLRADVAKRDAEIEELQDLRVLKDHMDHCEELPAEEGRLSLNKIFSLLPTKFFSEQPSEEFL